MSKTAALCATVFVGVFQDLRQGRGAFFVPSPVIDRLTWSDSFALAERAALLACKLRPLGLSDDCGLGYVLLVSIPTDGIL